VGLLFKTHNSSAKESVVKTLFLSLLIPLSLTANLAVAANLVYEIDLVQSKVNDDIAFNICGLPKEIKMDARHDLATVVIQTTQSMNPKDLEITTIQSTKGSVAGGGLNEPYMGDYRVRVAIVRLKDPNYPSGIYNRVEVRTYGSTAAPKAFIVDVELLNYRESAELAENSVCSGFAYKLK